MDPRAKRVFVDGLLQWGRANRRPFPWREERDPFRVLVAEVLLQRSRGSTVAKVYEELFGRWGDAEALSRAPRAALEDVIRPLGLIRRAVTLKALAAEVATRGAVPRSVIEMMDLPGVGRYAASATATVAFGDHEPPVDSVTARVYRRYFGRPIGLDAAVDDDLWSLVREATDAGTGRELGWAALDLAAAVCLPRVPRCEECPLWTHCAWVRATSTGDGSVGRMTAL